MSVNEGKVLNFHIWVGDMANLLESLFEKVDIKIQLETVLTCPEYLEKQFDTVAKSKRMAILSQYLYDFGLFNEAWNIWMEGLSHTQKHMTKGDQLQFKMNLGKNVVLMVSMRKNSAMSCGRLFIIKVH
jgi:hypothetical protein